MQKKNPRRRWPMLEIISERIVMSAYHPASRSEIFSVQLLGVRVRDKGTSENFADGEGRDGKRNTPTTATSHVPDESRIFLQHLFWKSSTRVLSASITT